MASSAPDVHAVSNSVLDRLIADDVGDTPWADLVLAACSGAEALKAALDGESPPRPARKGSRDETAVPEPPGAYLASITVEGFRGIGPAAALTLRPGPGLTLVVGRNGSGKSSFAEGLELLLTGGNKRWDGRSAIWKDSWRCLHRPNPCLVRAEFAAEALGTVTVERQWEEGATLDGSTAWFQAKGAPRRPYDELGWQRVIRTHRPLLPYTELGAVFDKPSEIHDALVEVLGLGEFDAVQKTLQAVRKEREAIVSEAAERLKRLLPRLTELAQAGEQRAVAAAHALKNKKPDLDAIRAVLDDSHSESSDEGVGQLRQAMLYAQPPAREAVSLAVGELRAAAGDVAATEGTDAARARELARLLGEALRYHDAHRGDDCPVCGTTGALGGTWRGETEQALAQLRSQADAAERAHARLERQRAAAHDLLRVSKRSIEAVGAMNIASVAAAVDALDRWAQGTAVTDPLALAMHLEAGIDEISGALEAFRTEVASELARREDLWRPVATELRDWVPHALAAEEASAQVALLKKAEAWFKGVQADLRAERFRPIADRAKDIWHQLRQQSNVGLEDVALKGTATQRSVELSVTVDGVAGAALGVMSQGELNALALSLFMPRASLPDSPFRFMVIDDPVQSMDPSRVDGLARALHEAARTRQVVVFTHDERLPDAVRHLQIPASVIEVTRRPGSIVETRLLKSPVERYFDDAMTIVRTENLPADVQRRLVPGFCRSGVEAACADAFRRRRLKAGAMHQDIEEDLRAADSLRKRLALALLDDVTKAGDVSRRLASMNGADFIVKALNEGAHGEYDGGLERLTRDAERLAAQIGALK
jgi:DNA repair exonuclease SbcCD ATPase subunit